MPWGAAVGGALAYLGADKAGDAQRDAANSAANASKFTPYNVYSGFGSGTFDAGSSGTPGYWSGGRYQPSSDPRQPSSMTGQVWNPGTGARAPSATASLNPEYQALRNQFLQQAGSQNGAFTNYNPEQASADIYGKLSALSAPEEERQRLALENRLLQQGMLGSTGGGIRQQALFDSQGQSRIARELQSYTTAQDTLNQMQSRAINATNAASGLDSLALQNLNLGGVFGGRQTAANQFGANLQYQAAQNSGDSMAQFWAGIGQQVAPAVNNYFNRNSYNDGGMFSGSQYSPSYGGAAYGGSSAWAP